MNKKSTEQNDTDLLPIHPSHARKISVFLTTYSLTSLINNI